MTLLEAQQIGRIIAQAHNGCFGCVSKLVESLNAAFPEFHWEVAPGGMFYELPTDQTVTVRERN